VNETCPKSVKSQGFIYGGTNVTERIYPWVGAVFKDGEFVCGSSLSKEPLLLIKLATKN
jgi:hypothetical protein